MDDLKKNGGKTRIGRKGERVATKGKDEEEEG